MSEPFGVTVMVTVNGQNLPVYPDPQANIRDTTTQSFFLEAKAGDTYEIETSLEEALFDGCDAIVKDIEIDGAWMNGSFMRPEWGSTHTTSGVTKAYATGRQIYPFVFDIISLSDDSATMRNTAAHTGDAKDLGTIVVELYRVKKLSRARQPSLQDDCERPGEPGSWKPDVLLDRGIDITTRLGNPQPTPPFTVRNCEDFDEDPFRIVRLQYRSREMLQFLGVIPSPHSPGSLGRLGNSSQGHATLTLSIRPRPAVETAVPSIEEDRAAEGPAAQQSLAFRPAPPRDRRGPVTRSVSRAMSREPAQAQSSKFPTLPLRVRQGPVTRSVSRSIAEEPDE